MAQTIATFDIGRKAFAWSVITWNNEKERKDEILSVNLDEIDPGTKKNDRKSPMELRKTMISLLESRSDLWDLCDCFAIEHQFVVRGGGNIVAVKLAEVVITYFLIKYPDKDVRSMGGSKITPLGGPSKLPKPKRKLWVSEWAKEYIESYCSYIDDMSLLEQFAGYPKKDDVSDTLAMNTILAMRLKLV